MALFSLLFSGCADLEPERTPNGYFESYVHAACSAHSDCGCVVEAETCESRLEDEFREFLDAVEEDRLEFDPHCAAQLLDRVSARACIEPSMAREAIFQANPEDSVWGCLPCSVLHGDRSAGAGCEIDEQTGASNCASGLACAAGVCVERCRTAFAGDVCWRGRQQCEDLGEGFTSCTFETLDARVCAAGLTCAYDLRNDSPTSIGRCRPPKPDGEVCDTTAECGPQSYCLETCRALGTAGEACVSGFQCGSGICLDEACTPEEPLVCLAEEVSGEDDSDGEDSGGGETMPDSSKPPKVDEVEGLFLVAIRLPSSAEEPLQYLVETRPSGNSISLVFTPLSLDVGSTSQPREPLTPSFEEGPLALSERLSFQFTLHEYLVPAPANPISGSELQLSATFEALFEDADTLCGEAWGELTWPLSLDLEGTTLAGIRVLEGEPLPAVPSQSICANG